MLSKVITGVVVVAIFVPYRMSEYGQDSSFGQDFLVALIAFAIGGGLGYLIEGKKKKQE